MIEKMHEKSNGPVFKIIFALISISFVLGGIGSGFMTNDTSAVKINGTEVSQQVFNQAKNREQNQRNAEEGSKFWEKLEDPNYAKLFQDQVYNRLISDELLRQYADTLKLGISNEQVKSQIVNTPAFHQNGKFDNALYQQTLRNNGISADGYAAIVAEGMLMSQLQEGIISSDFSVPAQQDLLGKLLMQSREARLAHYPIANALSTQTASDEEAQQFYNSHKSNFVTPEKLTVEYVLFSPKALEKSIDVDNAQIETYYQTNKNRYVTAGESQLAHIQVATEEEAKALSQAVKNGEDFAKLAKEKSQDKASASQGGDLGWAKAGTFPAEFENAATALQIGQVSEPVKVDGSFHLIKLLNRKAESIVTLDKVKDQIADTIRKELIQTEYSSKTREMQKQAFENSGSLASVAEVAGVEVQKTAEFTAQSVPSELNHEAVIKQLFNTDLRKNGQNSEAVELGNETAPQTLFFRVSQYHPETEQSFEEAKNAVVEAVKLEKAGKAVLAQAEEDVKTLQSGTASNVKFAPSQAFVFAQTQIQQPAFAKVLFAMPKPNGKPQYQVLQAPNGDVTIIALDKVIDGDMEKFKPLATQLAQADQIVLYNNLISDLRQRAKIEINEEFAEQQLDNK